MNSMLSILESGCGIMQQTHGQTVCEICAIWMLVKGSARTTYETFIVWPLP